VINPLYESFPEKIRVNDKEYSIITDFREWIRFADMLADEELTAEEKVLAAAQWLNDPPEYISEGIIMALISFYRADALDPEMPEGEQADGAEEPRRPPVFSYKYDAKYIIGDFLRYYGIDLLTAEMHWWQFRCLMAALPDDSACQKRIAYRSADLSKIKDDAERHRIMEIQRRIAIPYEMTDDEISAVFEVRNE